MSAGGWLQLSAGRGPAECAWVLARLLPKLIAEAGAAGLRCEVRAQQAGAQPGTLQSVLLACDGAAFPAFAARWCGSVQWIGHSPFRPQHKRRNWFIGIESVQPPQRHHWHAQELHMQTLRASGPGGQHVNKTDSAVRITHLPSGLSSVARAERSQARNRALALHKLAQQLDARSSEAAAHSVEARWRCHDRLQRGDAVRVFVGPEFRERD
ncbi:peptide chain release factor H [Plasticicumulans acidivorans]|uniref:Peptide chain release factor n=1 Tax=Plasticicumulans acidivorans TaxID=886464 RepID=A0A317MS17_9GAMM|nr:peptide chain release factor H [Plasticicumulans acidivorans]PWV59756.1 peptide chain release factor [Plasticicumulans acidivorans]